MRSYRVRHESLIAERGAERIPERRRRSEDMADDTERPRGACAAGDVEPQIVRPEPLGKLCPQSSQHVHPHTGIGVGELGRRDPERGAELPGIRPSRDGFGEDPVHDVHGDGR